MNSLSKLSKDDIDPQIYRKFGPKITMDVIKARWTGDETFMQRINKSKKGRKRQNKVQDKSFYEFLIKTINPKWETALQKVSMDQREIDMKLNGEAYAWFEFLKDIRKVKYRIFTVHENRLASCGTC